MKRNINQGLIYAAVLTTLTVAFLPIILMLGVSLKTRYQLIVDFWGFPYPFAFGNYAEAVKGVYANVGNSLIYASAATVLVALLSAMGGYVFGVLDFPGRNALYMLLISFLMIPAILILTPRLALINSLGLRNSPFALILPWASGGQIMGIMLVRSAASGQPKEIFESARIDGAGEFRSFWSISIPIALPILTTIAVMNFMSYYNDYLWPLTVISDEKRQVATVAIQMFQSNAGDNGVGQSVAAYAVITVPLLVMFIFSSRVYMSGLTSGAVKT
ncbi:MAG: carbohydrate ABC transporter permease [Clostridiales bacterium]|nr:carbohydrate ABC transporter permease [Clostridiales bacterium]